MKHFWYRTYQNWLRSVLLNMSRAVVKTYLFHTVVSTEEGHVLAVWNDDGFGWINESRKELR